MERRAISDEERSALESFLRVEISLDGLLERLHGMVEITFSPMLRRFTSYLELVEPPIWVSSADLDRAVLAYKSGAIDDAMLMRWATMLVLNDAYLWDEDDESIADALHELSIGGIQSWKGLKGSAESQRPY